MNPNQKHSVFKEFTTKLSAPAQRSLHTPPIRNPILQTDVTPPQPKPYNITLINLGTQPSGRGNGKYATQAKTSRIFAEPTSDFTPSIKCIQPTSSQAPVPMSLKRSEWQPARIDPILQDSLTVNPPKQRDNVLKSSVFSHLDQQADNPIDSKERQGKYFDSMNSKIFVNEPQEIDASPKKKLLGQKAEIADLLKTKSSEQCKSEVSVKDPNKNSIMAKDLQQKKVLNSVAQVYRVRRNNSAIFF